MPPRRQRAGPSNISNKAKDSNENVDKTGASAAESTSTPAPVEPKKEEARSTPVSATASAGSSRGRAALIAKPKFVGRRSQAARAELQKQAAEKKAADDAERAHEKKPSGRGRGDFGRGQGGRGRGRGGTMGQSVASGPFGSGHANEDARMSYAKRSGLGGSGVFGGDFSAFRGGGSSGYRNGIKNEDSEDAFGRMHSMKQIEGGYISSDDDEDPGKPLQKQDIDEFYFKQYEDTDEANLETSTSFDLPRRLNRIEVKGRIIGVSAEDLAKRSTKHDTGTKGSEKVSEKKKGKARAKDIEITGSGSRQEQPTAHDASSDSDGATAVKAEPNDDDMDAQSVLTLSSSTMDEANTTSESIVKEAPSSPESKRKAKGTDGSRRPFRRPKTPPYRIQQEVDWFHQRWDDREAVVRELGQMVPKSDPENAESSASEAKQQSVRSDRVYFFQLPPRLPDLLHKVKPDPEAPTENTKEDDEAMEVDPIEVKKEADAPKSNFTSKKSTVPKRNFPSGLVGKLRVHESGYTTLDWGGFKLILRLGFQDSCPVDVMMARVPDSKPKENLDEAPQEPGRALCMGQVRGSFVLTPDWDELLP